MAGLGPAAGQIIRKHQPWLTCLVFPPRPLTKKVSSDRSKLLIPNFSNKSYCPVCDRRFFDLTKWKVVLVDQRGCGASKPKGELKGNTTQVQRLFMPPHLSKQLSSLFYQVKFAVGSSP
eukprot:scaffold3024_cov27-Prasinocladus_malaysianus.AAC.2